MAIDFPNSPTLGDTTVASNGATYYYDGTKWTLNAAFVSQIAAISKDDTSVAVADTGTGIINVIADGTLVANVTAANGFQVRADLFTIADNTDATKKVIFNVANIATGTTRTLSFPDATGTVLLSTSTDTLTNKTFDNTTTINIKDANLTIQDDVDTTKQLKFQVSGLTTGTTRTLTVPDANGTIATTTLAQTIANKTFTNTNTITIHDANLTIQDNVDATKQAKFELSGLTTGQTKTLTFPDANTTLVGTDIAQTLTNKTITIQDANLSIIDNADATKIAKFEASSITTGTTKTFTLPDANTTLVGANAAQTLTSKTLDNTSIITIHDANLTIQDNADATKQAKFELSGLTTGQTKTFTLVDANTTLVGTDTAQTLTNKTITIQDANLSIIDNADATKIAKFEASGITTGTTKTFTFPDANTTLVGANAAQTLTSKTLDNTSIITIHDANLTIQDNADATKQVKFELSGITTGTTKTLTVPDANTTIVGANATQTLANKTIDNTNTVTLTANRFTLQDQTDNTKQAQFIASGITTATTRTFTFPDANTTLVGDNIAQTLTNKTINILDANLTLQDNVDTTKQARFELTNITTATTRIFSLPDANTILVGTDTSQTLTNKTISSGLFTGTTNANRSSVTQAKLHDPSVSSVALGALSTGTTTVNLANGTYFSATINSSALVSFAFAGLTGTTTNQAFAWTMEITNGGAGTVTWFANTKWPGGTAPALTTSGVDILTFITADAGTTIRGVMTQKASA